MEFEVRPLDGIYWDDKKIKLGYTKDEVKNILGKPDVCRNIYYYFNSELSFHFDDNSKVEFIEFLSGIDGEIQPIIYGTLAFKILADELYMLLSHKNMGEIDDSENGYSYAFKNISVGIYRESIPSSINEMIEEMKNEGIDTENNENIEIEKKKALNWCTLGIGCINYYR